MNDKYNDGDKILDYVLGHLSKNELAGFEDQMKHDKDLEYSVEETRQSIELFKNIDTIKVPETSQSMDDGFYAMLNTEKSKQQISAWDKLSTSLGEIFTFDNLKPVLYGAAMMTIGVYLGHYYQPNTVKTEINNLVDVEHSNKMQKLAVVSMLQLPSVSSRLQAVSLVGNSDQNVTEVGDVVITALFHTLNNDTNINVRLAVLNTLAAYSNTPNVRAGLVNSILSQHSPMVQVAISELMLNLQETKAIEPLQQLLKDKNTINTAKERITLALDQLI